MSTNYDQAPKEIAAAVEKVMKQHHRDLVSTGVTLDLLVAFKDTKDGQPQPAMRTRGHDVLAKTSITSLIDRAAGRPDAKIIIDRVFGWDRLGEGPREALLHRELQKLELQFDKDGELKRDDHRRPKLKIRPFDWEHSGFESELELYGEASIASKQLTHFMDSHGQFALFPGPGIVEVKIDPDKNLN